MLSVNKVILVGNLTKDPELKSLPSGSSVASFSIATNRNWKDANGGKKEEVQFHNIVSFGKQAETIAQYMAKGSQIYIEGRIQNRSWEGNDGKRNYRTEIVIENFQFGNSKGRSEESQEPEKEEESVQAGEPTSDYPENDIDPNDIPF